MLYFIRLNKQLNSKKEIIYLKSLELEQETTSFESSYIHKF